MYRGKKTGSAGKPASTPHDGLPARTSSYRGRKTGAAGPPAAGTSHVGFPEPASSYRGVKTAASGQAEPAMPAPRAQARHRMAGSHDGMYVTEHHRGAKKG